MDLTQLLLRLFVKDYRNTEDPAVRTRYGKLAGIVGIVCNVLLSAGKLLAGTLSGAVSITADGLNNLTDAASSLVTLLGFRLAARPADEKHPYGHARMEYLSGLAVAVMILVIGVELVKSSVQKILHPEAVEFSIDLTYYINRSDQAKAVTIQENVKKAVAEYTTWQTSEIGRDINPDELVQRIKAAGAKRVELTAPTFAVVGETQVAKCTASAADNGGLEDD